MNPILKQMLDEGTCLSPSGDTVAVRANIGAGKVSFLTGVLQDMRPAVTRTLEVGLAFGASALCICEATKDLPGAHHVVIDPYQHAKQAWNGLGLHNLERSGFGGMVEFFQTFSSTALPKLVEEKRIFDFAFIDGSHLFDDAFVDFYYVDKMLRLGGVVVFDDLWMASQVRLCRYVLSNRHYEVVGSFRTSEDEKRATKWGPRLARALAPKVPKAHVLFRRELLHPEIDRALGLPCRIVALRKLRHDDRKWDFHVDF